MGQINSESAGSGNPAGVVWDARGLDDTDMQRIAQVNNLSETAFLFPNDNPALPYRIRFFTPTKPIPMCGHASIASAYVYWLLSGRPERLEYQQAAEIGQLGICVVSNGSPWPQIFLDMDWVPMTRNIDHLRERYAATLGCTLADFRQDLPLMANARGYAYLPFVKLGAIQSLEPSFLDIAAIDSEFDLHGAYVFCEETLRKDTYWHCRFFAPSFGVNEDPVTGTANAYSVPYILQFLGGPDKTSFQNEQGFEMGRGASSRYLTNDWPRVQRKFGSEAKRNRGSWGRSNSESSTANTTWLVGRWWFSNPGFR